MKKKLLSAALVLCLLLTLLPMAAFAADDVQTGTCGDGLTWTLDTAGTLTVSGSGEISANAFAVNSRIVRAEIGAGVTGIGMGAFLKCANLEAVTLPAGLTTLGTAAFAYCEKLAAVTLPGTLKSTGGGAFQGCTALASVTILPGVARIDTRTFSDCAALKEITIPASVTAIGDSAFSGCLTLRTVHFGGSKEAWQAVEVGEHNPLLRLARVDYNAVTGHHFGDWTVTTEATCTEPGVRTRTCTDAGCAETETEAIPALGHDWGEWVTTIEPTYTTVGYRYHLCARCNTREGEDIPKLHTHTWDAGVVTQKPTATEPGVKTFTCTICGETKTEPIPATGVPDVCPGGPTCPGYAFRDMPVPTDWAHEGLDYCIYHGYIAGTSASTVSPNGVCTRAQLVSILYRVQGEPTTVKGYELSKLRAPFNDVPRGQWYTDAIWWAKLMGVVSGTSATTFDPEGEITREQLAVILYNYTKQFAPGSLTATGSLAGFPDAASVSSWARTEMAWAVGNGLISGTGSGSVAYLTPQGSATRAQVAAILMRFEQAMA